MPVNFFHGSKSPMENGWFTIRIIQPKQLNNHSIIQKLRSLGGWNRRIYTQKPIGFRALVLQGLGWRFFGAQHGIANGGHWFCRSLLWTCSQQLNLKPLRISVQNVFLQEKMAPKFPKGLPFFQQIRSTWVSPWPFWGLFRWLLLWCVSARGGPEFLEVRHHYVASAS